MKTKITLILLLFLSLLSGSLFAQVQINTPVSYQPVTLQQGGAAGTYKVDIVNNGAALSNVTFALVLPAGMEYVTGSVTGAVQANIADLQKPTFTISSIPAGNTATLNFNARINCGYTAGPINYSILSGATSLATGSSAVAGNTPSPAFALTAAPAPQALTVPLSTDGSRTIKFKNSGNIPVTTVFIESTVVTASQAPGYKVTAANNGTVSAVTNGYRVVLTGTALQSAITTAVGAANSSFDPGEEIILVLTEQMLSCATGTSIPLTIKVGSTDTKNSFCYADSSTASIVTPAGNAAISLTRLTGVTLPTFCDSGKVSYTIKNEGTEASSGVFNIKLPWSSNYTYSGQAPNVEPAGQNVITKVSINGTDITSLVLKRNGTGTSALIPGLENCFVIDMAGLTSAYGTALQNLGGDGKFDDLAAGQSFQLDFEYGFNISSYQSCRVSSYTLPSTGTDYFSLGTSFLDQCGTRVNKTNYPSGGTGTTAPTFQIGMQQYNSFSASLSSTAVQLGDKIKLTTSFGGTFSSAFTQGGGKVTKAFTIILPDGLDYDPTRATIWKYGAGVTIPTSAISYNAATKTLSITPLPTLSALNTSNDNIEIPLVVSSATGIVNKTVQYSSVIGFTGCAVTVPYGCSSSTLNYAIVDTGCGKVGTTGFDMTRATFGYVPAPTNTNIWYTPTAFVNETTAGINLHGAVSKDKVKTTFAGIVNATDFTELWARVKYTSTSTTTTQSNFDKISATATDVAGTITVTKASDGSSLSTNITVADVLFSFDSATSRQLQQVNVGAKIGAGKAINYTLQAGDKITVNWFTKVTRDNLSYVYSALQNLEGDLFTKDSGGTSSDCQPIPLNFSIQRLQLGGSGFTGVQAVVGTNSLRVQASVLNGNASIDVPGDHFPNEVRNYAIFKNVKITMPGIWIMDTAVGKEPYISISGQVPGPYKVNPAMFTITYSGGNTIITATNDALGSDGLPLSTANIPVVADWIGANGNQNLSLFMLPVCATPGPLNIPSTQNYDLYTTAADNSTTESNVPYTLTQATQSTVYDYSANTVPTLQNVDGISSTVNWQVRVTNTSDTAAITAAGGTADLPNNWLSFVAPNNNITVTSVTDAATNISYPVQSYGAGKYWVKLGDIATNATYTITANYTACSQDKLQTTYGYGAIGYPIDPEQGYGTDIQTCPAKETFFDLNLYPKAVSLNVLMTSPQNPVQFCNNTTVGENLINYSLTVANTATGNAENLVLEAVFPAGYKARTGTSQLTYNGTTKTLSEPIYNVAKGVWQWNISTDPNGIPFLPGTQFYRRQIR